MMKPSNPHFERAKEPKRAVNVNFTESDYARLVELAEKYRITPTAMVRKIILDLIENK
jgi:replication initiation and membrane attachment protein DnaB